MKPIQVSDKIDLGGWGLDATEDYLDDEIQGIEDAIEKIKEKKKIGQEIILRAATEALKMASKEHAWCSLRVRDRKAGVLLSINLGDGGGEEPEWFVSILDIVSEYIENTRDSGSSGHPATYPPVLRIVRDQLLEAAEWIDDNIIGMEEQQAENFRIWEKRRDD